MTGRDEPVARDYEWCAGESDGAIQCTDPQDAVDFAAGMSIGANEAESA